MRSAILTAPSVWSRRALPAGATERWSPSCTGGRLVGIVLAAPAIVHKSRPLYSDYITIVNNAFVASGEGVAGIYEGGRNDDGEADGRGSYLYLARNRPPDRPPTYFQHAGLLPEPALPHTHRPLTPIGWQRLSGRVEARQAARVGELHLR